MKYIKQFAIIISICLLGELVARFLPFAFPGNILAMLILTFLLIVKVVKEESILETSDFLLSIIGLFIVPAAVGMMNYFELIRDIWFQILIICLITLIATFVSCVFTIRLVVKFMRLFNKRNV